MKKFKMTREILKKCETWTILLFFVLAIGRYGHLLPKIITTPGLQFLIAMGCFELSKEGDYKKVKWQRALMRAIGIIMLIVVCITLVDNL